MTVIFLFALIVARWATFERLTVINSMYVELLNCASVECFASVEARYETMAGKFASADTFRGLAVASLLASDVGKASNWVEKAYDQEPTDVLVNYWRAQAFRKSGRFYEELVTMRKATLDYLSESAFQSYIDRSVTEYYELEEYNTALAFAEAALLLGEDTYDVHYMIGRSYLGLQNKAAAFKAFQTAVQVDKHENTGESYYELGRLVYVVQPELASEYMVQAAANTLDEATMRYKIARFYIGEAENLAEAEEWANGLIADFPEEYFGYELRGRIAYESGDLEKAQFYLETAVSDDTTNANPWSHSLLADVYLKKGQNLRAIEQLESAVRVNQPGQMRVDFRVQLSQAYLSIGDCDSALTQITQAGQLVNVEAERLYVNRHLLEILEQCKE